MRDVVLVSLLCACWCPWPCMCAWWCPWCSRLDGALSLCLVSGWPECNECTCCKWWWWSCTWSKRLCVLVLAFDEEDSQDMPELTWWWFTLECPVRLPDELPWWWLANGVVERLLFALTTWRWTAGDEPPWFNMLEFDDAPLIALEVPWWSLEKPEFEG